MEEKSSASSSELEVYLRSFGAGFLFRGQVEHFPLTDGQPSIVSSQGRKGCVPSSLLKWTHYASEVIRSVTGALSEQVDPDLVQAILQHYGWRSFFVDLTAHYAVAAWFASHRWSSEEKLALAEDCHEEPVLTMHSLASYEQLSAGVGHIYIISRHRLEDLGIKCFDLCESITTDFKARFSAQDAWLAGPTSQPLPAECIAAHVSAPIQCLRDISAIHGFISTGDLFPGRGQDLILRLLLKAPMQRIGGDLLPSYRLGLAIPEYDYHFTKRHSPEYAFYTPTWIKDWAIDERDSGDATPLMEALFIRVPEDFLYARSTSKTHFSFPDIFAKLQCFGILMIEAEAISRMLAGDSLEYGKGVCVRLVEGSLVEICEIFVEHPGSEISGIGVNRGWFYRVGVDELWVREKRDGECTCGRAPRHMRHLWILDVVEAMLGHGKQLGEREISLLDCR